MTAHNTTTDRPSLSTAHFARFQALAKITSVSVLIRRRGPNAVAWLIVAVVVLAFERQASRTRPHVAVERRDIVAPLVAHRDAASAVVLVVLVVGVVATVLRAAPCAVLDGFDGGKSWYRVAPSYAAAA